MNFVQTKASNNMSRCVALQTCLFIAGLFALSVAASAADKPNVLVILADDLGFSDLGCYGGEIQTPALDSLAENGVRFSQFYNTARCWPTRSALLTGYYPQQIRRDNLPTIPNGNRGTRQPWAQLLPNYLKPLGYRSYHSGKWHIDGMPIANGFDRSYYLRDQGRFFSPQVHREDDKKLPPVERGTGYYGTTAIGQHAVKCLKKHHAKHAGQPFFHYLAFTAPHFPLHALPEDISVYKDTYNAGWTKIRDQRWQRIQDIGLLSGQLSAVEPDLGPPYHFPDHLEILGDGEVNRPVSWDSLTDKQKQFQATKMSLHAAMIHRMDIVIGEVLKQIHDMGQTDNTLIFFLSDNGSSAEIMVRNDGHDPTAAPGSAATYLCLGPGWSSVGNTPLRRHKTWTHEGGCTTPLIACWPDRIKDVGGFRRQVGHVIDLVPTIMEVAGGELPATHNDKPYPSRPGKSLLGALVADTPVDRNELWWFHDGHKAIRIGNMKAVAPKGEPWELYDLSKDRAESTDLSQSDPDKLGQLTDRWNDLTAEFTEIAKMDMPPQTSSKQQPANKQQPASKPKQKQLQK